MYPTNRMGTRLNQAAGAWVILPVLALLLVAIVVAAVANAPPALAATGNETTDTATGLGSFDTGTGGKLADETLQHSSDSTNFYRFTLTGGTGSPHPGQGTGRAERDVGHRRRR